MFYLFLIFLLIPFAFFWKAKEKKRNPYIEKHSQKIDDDNKYFEYLNWCAKKGEIPMDKKEWGEITDREKYINNLINK